MGAQKTIRYVIPVLACLILLGGCESIFSTNSDMTTGSPGTSPVGPGGAPFEFGATAGGVQDMGLARELVTAGRVPPTEAFRVEGMFSEHDLPLDGPAADRVLRLRGAVGIAPDRSGEAAAWVQVGLSSNVDPDRMERPTQTIVACVDVSGSMGWFYQGNESEYPTAGGLASQLLHLITDRLGAEDRVAIVTYGASVSTLLEPVPGNSPRIGQAIEELTANGSTNMEAGLTRAFALARDGLESETDAVRVLLFTDIQPNVGATEPGSFRTLARAAAQDGIGLTVYGLGVGMRQEIMNAIADLRGGNAFSCYTHQDVVSLVEDQWPWMFCPIAHDLELELTPPAGFQIGAAYGFPGDEPGSTAGFSVASVFLSRRRGALLVRLDPQAALPGHFTVTGRLSYLTADGAPVNDTLELSYNGDAPDDHGCWFQQPTLGKTVALATLVAGMQEAAQRYQPNPEQAIAIMRTAAQRIASDAERIADDSLAEEVVFARDMLALMEAGAEQGDMYGEHLP